jgi:hypothetical protein
MSHSTPASRAETRDGQTGRPTANLHGAVKQAADEAKRQHGIAVGEPVAAGVLAEWLPEDMRQPFWRQCIEAWAASEGLQ